MSWHKLHPREGAPVVFWGCVTAAVVAALVTGVGFVRSHLSDSAASPSPESSPTSTPGPAPTTESSEYWEAGWGPMRPTFTVERAATYPVFNSMTDNPNVGDERNFVTLRSETAASGATWSDDVWAEPGDTYLLRVYVSNSGGDDPRVDALQESIQGARIWIGLSKGTREFSAFGILEADNAKTAWDGATIHTDDDVDVVIDESTAKIETNAGTRTLRSSAFRHEGALLGFDKDDGIIGPRYYDSEYVTVKLRVIAQEPGT